MGIVKSSRHQKIIGDFGEALLCNWFSRSGFEVTIVDHTGIDIVAYNKKTDQRLGVSVKSRTRVKGKENSSVNLLSYQKNKNDRQKIIDACEAFGCDPWLGIYIETYEAGDLYLLSLEYYDNHYRGSEGRAIDDWKMGQKYRDKYEADSEVRHIRMEFVNISWHLD